MKFDELLERFDPRMRTLYQAVALAGNTVTKLPREFIVKPGEGHRSGATDGDRLAQELMIERITRDIPSAKILTEERTSHPSIIDHNNPVGVFDGVVVVMDPIDSTLHYGNDTGGWSVVAGLMENGRPLGSVLYAPGINGGFVLISETGKGVWTLEWGDKISRVGNIEILPANQSVVRLGVDTLLYRNITSIVSTIAVNVRGVLTTGSGALGLAMVAAGRAQAVVQTPQKVWDWAAMYQAVIESGNYFWFFRIMHTGEIKHISSFDFDSFRKTPSKNRLGFVAGEHSLVGRLIGLLPNSNWSRIDPDTTSGSWS